MIRATAKQIKYLKLLYKQHDRHVDFDFTKLAKDSAAAMINKLQKKNPNRITNKQRSYLDKLEKKSGLKVMVPKGSLSRYEASKLIEEMKEVKNINSNGIFSGSKSKRVIIKRSNGTRVEKVLD